MLTHKMAIQTSRMTTTCGGNSERAKGIENYLETAEAEPGNTKLEAKRAN